MQNDRQIRTTISLLNCLQNDKEIREIKTSLNCLSNGMENRLELRANIEKTKKAKALRLSYNLNNIISHRRPRHDTRAGKRKTRGR